MKRTVGIGIQSFEKVRENHCFYVDKTKFIKEWWENKDDVTLITRPRRFGKTLMMDTVEQFFSVKYKDNGRLFEGLSIWEEEEYRKLQGTYPVIFLCQCKGNQLSFSDTPHLSSADRPGKIRCHAGAHESGRGRHYHRIQGLSP